MGRTFEVKFEPVFFTEEIVGFRVVSYREIRSDSVGQTVMKSITPPEPSLFPEDEISPLLDLRT